MLEERSFRLTKPYQGSKIPMKGVCLTCGEEGKPIWNNIKRGQGACNPCGRKKQAKALNLDHEYVERFMLEERSFRLTKPYQASKIPMKGVCLTCGEERTPTWDNIRQGQGACDPCGRKEGRKKVAKLLRHDPAFVRREMIKKHNFLPTEPYVNAHTPMRGICLVCKSPGAPRWSDVKSGDGACSGKCKKTGMKYHVPAVAYLVGGYVKDAGPSLKVGIAEAQREKGRLSDHKRVGLDTHLATLHFPTGYEAKEFENELKYLINTEPGNLRDTGLLFNGSKETFELESADPEFLRDLLSRFGITNVFVPNGLWSESNYRSRFEAWSGFALAA